MTEPQSYDRTTIVLHWTTAFLVVVIWLLAQFIDEFAGAGRVAIRSTHILLGVVLLVVLAWRLIWRATRGRHLPQADPQPLHLIAKATHWSLYALLAAMVLVGLAYAWVRGDSIFGLFRIPAFDPANARALRRTVGGVHGMLANIILIVAGLHALAALFHHFRLRDNVLRRMWPSAPG